MTAAQTRTRLQPEQRRQQLLDTAREMIIAEGLQSFSMEALARTASVSSPLVYNYFASRKALLQALLLREYNAYVANLNAQVGQAPSFADVVRVFVTSNFDHHAPGNLLPILTSQPEIAAAIKIQQTRHNQQTARLLVKNMAQNFKLSIAQAELLVLMSSGASIAAAQYGARTSADREQTIDTVLAYVFAGLNQIANTRR